MICLAGGETHVKKDAKVDLWTYLSVRKYKPRIDTRVAATL